MQTRDHKVLAEFLVSEIKQELSTIYIKAFILGNVEPDRNPFTYLHGLVRGVKFHGHNYENILPVMDKLFDSLHGKKHWGAREYYYFGKLLHYVADAFTLPHNRIFKGNLREHCRYEKELHKSFLYTLSRRTCPPEGDCIAACPKGYMLQELQKQPAQKRGRCNGLDCIKKLHEEYLQQAGNCENDCRYILKAAVMLVQEETGTVRKIDFSRCEKNSRVIRLGNV